MPNGDGTGPLGNGCRGGRQNGCQQNGKGKGMGKGMGKGNGKQLHLCRNKKNTAEGAAEERPTD